MEKDRKNYLTMDASLHEQMFVEKSDIRRWNYCGARFLAFWREHGCPDRRVPQNHRSENGKVGWFFPSKWLRDFEFLPAQEPKREPTKLHLSLEQRGARVERAIRGLQFPDQISAKEVERWKLPAGTQVTPHEVIYPDGSRERVDELRLRNGKYRPGSPQQSSEQQLLEDTLRTLHRKAVA